MDSEEFHSDRLEWPWSDDWPRLFSLRFGDEAVHSAGLLHANIATVFDYGEDDGLAYLVVELADQGAGQRSRRTLSELTA